MKTSDNLSNENTVQGNPDKLQYWANQYHIDKEQVQAALQSVGNDEKLLEGFLRKNVGLRTH